MERPIAVITGASSGIGEAFARRLAPTHDLVLVARRRDRLDALAAELSRRHGAAVEALGADLAEPAGLAAVETRLADNRLALLVNNAGFGTKGLFWEAALEGQERMHALHVMATVRLTHAALRPMVARDRGAVVNVASVAAFARRAGNASYGATKSWMTAFTEGLHLELRGAGSKVSVQALCPGFTITGFHEAMKMDRAERAGPSFWLTADAVAAASLDGLRRGRLFVIPGWRYRLLVAVIGKLPAAVRVALERMA
jgi:hypothetical protein